jgi:hypothetical protein
MIMKQNKDKPVYIKQSFLPKLEKIRKLLVEKYPKCFVDKGMVNHSLLK